MAHLTTQRTTKGETRYVVRYRAPDGKERQRWFARRTRRGALSQDRRGRSRARCLDRPALGERDIPSVGVGMARGTGQATLCVCARRNDRARAPHTAFGDRALGSITPADVRRLVVEWSAKYAPRTTKRHYGILRAIMASAVAADMIGRSPCRGVRLPAAGDSASHVVDGGELQLLAAALGPSYGPMAYLGAVLGLRWGEVAGMRVGGSSGSEERSRSPNRSHVGREASMSRDRRSRKPGDAP